MVLEIQVELFQLHSLSPKYKAVGPVKFDGSYSCPPSFCVCESRFPLNEKVFPNSETIL